MPSLDGGHLFLTVFAPVIVGDDVDGTGAPRSHRHLLAKALAELPTGQQTARSPADAPPSPFARNTLNHLARFVVIDGPAYNGRVSGDTLLTLSVDPLAPQAVDALPGPYLVFAADVDAQGMDEAGAVRAYADALWATMRPELDAVFGHCRGFAGADTAERFFDYIRGRQIETTMPFNDYWADDDLTRAPDAISGKGIGIGAGVLAVALLLLWLLTPVRGWPWWGVALLVLAVAAVAVFALYRHVLALGAKPFPAAPGADLPGVLKALFLQQAFTRFAVAAQGASDAELHESFGRFVAAARPVEATPAQPPGALRAPGVAW